MKFLYTDTGTDGSREDIKQMSLVENEIPREFTLWYACHPKNRKRKVILLTCRQARAKNAKEICTYVKGRLLDKDMPRTWLRNKSTRAR